MVDYKQLSAHRLSWMLNVGPIPGGVFVCHRCDNPSCVKPGHLFLATQKENMQDASAKGRTSHMARFYVGENNPNAKLTAKQVDRIRAIYSKGRMTYEDLGRRFGVTNVTISDIISGRKWGRVSMTSWRAGQRDGEANGNARLTADQVRELRQIAEGHSMTQKQLAKRFKVSPTTVHLILTGKRWKDV